MLLHVNRAKRAQRAPKRLICVCCPSAGMAVEWQWRKPNVRTHCTGASASARHPPAGTCPPQLYASLPLLLPRPALICRQAASHVTEEKGDNGVSLERVSFFCGRGWGGLLGRHPHSEGVQLPFINSAIACRPSVRSSQTAYLC